MKLPRLFLIAVLLLNSCKSPDILSVGESSSESLTIAYAEGISSYSPLSYEATDRKFLTNIYESLVRFDRTFNTETGLAVSWGRIDDTTWDFRLREGVAFHDGSGFDADDVLYSLNLAREDQNSELSALLSTIVDVTKTEDYRVEIKTSRPDPLLLNKLSYVYMLPSGYDHFDIPDGTGPYQVSQYIDDALVLERFDRYWGPAAFFREVRLQTITNPEDRLAAFLNGDIDVLANVPPQYVDQIEELGGKVKDFPSLEVSFLMLNQNGPFEDEHLRAAVSAALRSDFSELGGGYLLPSSQFAAVGISGYDANAEGREQNNDLALAERALVPGDVSLTLDLPEGLESLGSAIQEDLAAIDVQVTVNAIHPTEYEEYLAAGTSDFYFFGWKYDLADSEDFFDSVVHSPDGLYGAFNYFGYKNEQLDTLIEEASTQLQASERRAVLEEISSLLRADQVVIPLFEGQVLYATQPDIYYDFRLDGLIWASEIVKNMVK